MIKLRERPFYFHAVADKGVMSHFYKLGYHIKGDVSLVFDVGANIGDETLRFRHFHPKAKIVAIEASGRNFELLKKNFDHDELVVLINGALWHETGVLNLQPGTRAESFHIAGVSKDKDIKNHGEIVDAYTVPFLLDRLGINDKQIDVFKIDVEGAEEFIFLNGDTQWLNLVQVLIMEMPDNDRAGSFQKIITHLSAMNIWGDSYICGENYVFCKEGCDFKLIHLIGLGA